MYREGEMERMKEMPRDGRIAACGVFFTVVGTDGAVRLYDTEATIGIVCCLKSFQIGTTG